MPVLIPATAKPCHDCFQRSNRNYYYSHQQQILKHQKEHYEKNKAAITAKRRLRYRMKKLKKQVGQEIKKLFIEKNM